MSLTDVEREGVLRAIERFREDESFGRLVLLGYVSENNVDEVMSMVPENLLLRFVGWLEVLVQYEDAPVGWEGPLEPTLRAALQRWLGDFRRVHR